MTFGGREYKRPEQNPAQGGSDVPRDPQGGGPDAPPDNFQENRGNQRDQPYDNRGGGRPSGGSGFGSAGGQRGGGGGGNRGGGGYQPRQGGGSRDPNFAFISYLYGPSTKGAYSVFLKRDMIELLQSLEDNDILGISQTDKGWSLWARKNTEQSGQGGQGRR